MTLDWTPSEDVLKMLADLQIPDAFWKKQLPNFRIYWKERHRMDYWGYRFISWVRKGWMTEIHTQPVDYQGDWQPDYSELSSIGIDTEEAQIFLELFRSATDNLQGSQQQLQRRFMQFIRYQKDLASYQKTDSDP